MLLNGYNLSSYYLVIERGPKFIVVPIQATLIQTTRLPINNKVMVIFNISLCLIIL